MEINSITNLIKGTKLQKNIASNKLTNEGSSEKFIDKFANVSKDNSVKNADTSVQNEKKIPTETNEVSYSSDKEDKAIDKDSEETKKVSDLILALLNGNIDFNKFQEELDTTAISGDVKSAVLQIASLISNSKDGNILNFNSDKNFEELNEQLKQLIKEDKNTSINDLKSIKDIFNNVTKSLKSSDKNGLIESLKSFTENITEKINNNSENNTLDSLLATRFVAASKVNVNSGDTAKKTEVKVEDILSSLTQKKSENNDTAMMKINGLINSMDNNRNNQSIDVVSEQPMTINKGTINEDIIKSIKFMNLNQIKELTVKANPKELGEVVIKLVVDGNTMKANIQTSNKEAYNLLNSQVNELSKNLQEIKIQSVSVNISQQDTTFFSGQFNEQSQNREQSNNKRNVSSSSGLGFDSTEETNDIIIDSNINALA